MRLSDKGLLEICEHEGIVPTAYKDSKGIWTFGVGHTASAGAPDPISMSSGMPVNVEAAIDRALEVFRKDVVSYENRVNAAIKVPLKQHQFDALVSWDFNTGGASWRSGSGKPCQLVQQVNSGDMSGAGFMGWLKPIEIKKRRQAEMRLFQTGNYDANGDNIPVWKTNGAGRLTGILKTLHGYDVLVRMGRGAVRPDVDPPAPRATEVPGQGIWAVIMRLLSMLGRK